MFDLDEDEAFLYNSILHLSGNISIGLGASIGGRITAYFGFRKVILSSMGLITFGVLLKIVYLSFWNIEIGRIAHGIGAGILGFSFSKCMNETIP